MTALSSFVAVAVLVTGCSLVATADDKGASWSFETDRVGAPPAGFEVAVGNWKIQKDPTAPSKSNVVAQLAKNSRPTFNVLLASHTSYRDVDISVKMSPIAGEIDQGGGLVWRTQDVKNYYIVRYNPLEDNYRVYKVVEGRRQQLQSAEIERSPGWHTLRVTMKGDQIECYYDGTKYLTVKDSTFKEAGKIGLWTKADAQSRFDDLIVRDAPVSDLDAKIIGQAAGTTATVTSDGIVRIGKPRTDVSVKVDGMPFKPFAGLGSWAAFKATDHGAMVMGDTVVFQDEVAPAMDAAFAAGLQVTALHNHFFFDEPKVYFMHVGGTGDAIQLARGVKSVWDAIAKVRARRSEPATRFPGGIPEPGSIDQEGIEDILGHKGTMRDGILKLAIGREGKMHGTTIAASMGLTTWAAFSGSDTLAAVDGDFIMTAVEVQPVLKALRKANIFVVALHNHMMGEEPAFYFTHFWGKGPAKKLAQGIKDALKAQADARKEKEGSN